MRKLLLPMLGLLLIAGCGKRDEASSASGSNPAGKQATLALMPNSKGNSFFFACRKGAEEAAKELGVKLLWEGPTEPDPAKQIEIVETWISRGVDVIAVAVANKEGISTVLRKARQKGIKVVTWDSDAMTDARDFFVNQATPEAIGTVLLEQAAKVMNDKGEYAVITGSLTAANMNEWQKYIKLVNESRFPELKQIALRPCDDLKDKAFSEATALINANPNLKLILAICSPAVPGAAEAVKQAGKENSIKVVGLGLPNENKRYVKEGITPAVILWNTTDLGYLTVQTAAALATGELKAGDKTMKAGRLGEMQIVGDNVLLGKPFVFTKENIDQFDF